MKHKSRTYNVVVDALSQINLLLTNLQVEEVMGFKVLKRSLQA
jgi:hypothetical protein